MEDQVLDQQTDTTVVDDVQQTDTSVTGDVSNKPVQTPEERARFAERRRMMESPEYKLAKSLADHYGTTPEQMLQQLSERQRQELLQKEAQRLQASPELTKEIQEIRGIKTELQRQKWEAEMSRQEESLKGKFKLTDEQVGDAYEMVAQNPALSLEQAFRLTDHYDNILAQSRTDAEQAALAQVTRRGQTQPNIPQGTTTSGQPTGIWDMSKEAFDKLKKDSLRQARQG
jgi:hypothetical protein